MRAERLLSILLLLQVHRKLTARDLAERLEVSPRTVHRDMEALSMAGVPVYAERGSGGGWILPGEYRTQPTGLSEAEVRALFLAKPSRLLADLGLDAASEGALVKLLASLPSSSQRDAEYARERIHVDGAGWRTPSAEEHVPLLPTLQEAVWRDRMLRIAYGPEQGGPSERLVGPLGLVAKGRLWYLVATVEGGELRTYRVSRIRRAELLDEPAPRPEGFDLAAYWEQSKARFVAALPRFPVVVRAHASIVPRMRHTGRWERIEREEPPDAEGWCEVRIRFEGEDEAREYALSFGPHLEVVEPRALREQVLLLARRTVALYGGGPEVAGSGTQPSA